MINVLYVIVMLQVPNYPDVFVCPDGSVVFRVAVYSSSSHRERRFSINGEKYYRPATGGRIGKYPTVLTPHGVACVHVLVCSAYHGVGRAGQEVRHLNGWHTDNRPENLAWGSRRQNSIDTVVHGGGNAKLHPSDVISIRRRLVEGETCMAIAEVYQVSHMTIRRVKKREAWAWLENS